MLAVALLAAITGAAGCSVEPEADVTSGTGTSDSFKKLVKYYELDLPAGISDLEWAETKDWDSNQLYLHLSADAAGAETVLASYSTHLEDARPYRRGLCRSALPLSSSWSDQLPDDVARWQPSPGVEVRCGVGSAFGPVSADVLVVTTDGVPRELFLHVSR